LPPVPAWRSGSPHPATSKVDPNMTTNALALTDVIFMARQYQRSS
jgi:hypothetical protein